MAGVIQPLPNGMVEIKTTSRLHTKNLRKSLDQQHQEAKIASSVVRRVILRGIARMQKCQGNHEHSLVSNVIRKGIKRWTAQMKRHLGNREHLPALNVAKKVIRQWTAKTQNLKIDHLAPEAVSSANKKAIKRLSVQISKTTSNRTKGLKSKTFQIGQQNHLNRI